MLFSWSDAAAFCETQQATRRGCIPRVVLQKSSFEVERLLEGLFEQPSKEMK